MTSAGRMPFPARCWGAARRWGAVALLLLCAMSLQALPAFSEEHGASVAPGEGAGSASIARGAAEVLRVCWSPEDLPGRPEERKVRFLAAPDPHPPARETPETHLPPLPESLRGSIRRVDLPEGLLLVALTFDLCEGPREVTGYDGKIVDYLREQGVAATFFAGGKWMRSHAERAMQLMADPLFEVGNHAWTHGNLRRLGGERMREQVLRPQAEYEELRALLADRALGMGLPPEVMDGIPPVPRLFRFPYGTCNPESLGFLAEQGLVAVQWDVVSADPVPAQGAAAMAGVIKRGVRPGSIIICHANGRGHHTVEALPLFVPWLRERGYRFVTVSELLQAGRPVAVDDCYENRPGDNRHYDRIFGDGL